MLILRIVAISALILGEINFSFAKCAQQLLSRRQLEKQVSTQSAPRVVFMGFGAVAQAVLPILIEKVAHRGITVLDFEDRNRAVEPFKNFGVNFKQVRITEDNLSSVLSKYLRRGDVLVDLAWNIDIRDLLQWCRENGVKYVNTSTEVWDPYSAENTPPQERTLYHRHQILSEFISGWGKNGPTAVLEHGANPGLISHFAKQGILDIAAQYIVDGFPESKTPEFKKAFKNQEFNQLARLMGIKVIHVSERDTQISSRPKEVGEFVNTWSVPGFHEEGTTTAELGWGTHERKLPKNALTHRCGPKNQICLAQMGMHTWVRSVVPGYQINGMVIRHGEAYSLSKFLSVEENGEVIYRPTVHYAYMPADAAIASLNELVAEDYKYPEKMRIMNDDIISGADILGALLMGHRYQSWWTGSDLSIEEARRLVPGQNATTIQVAISVVSTVKWMIENPNRGVLLPEDLPHDQILEMSKPYLGKWISEPINWNPLMSRPKPFGDFRTEDIDPTDPWQFQNFQILN